MPTLIFIYVYILFILFLFFSFLFIKSTMLSSGTIDMRSLAISGHYCRRRLLNWECCAHWISLWECGGMVLGKLELSSRGLDVFFIIDISSASFFNLLLIFIGFPLSSLPSHVRYPTVGGRNSSFVDGNFFLMVDFWPIKWVFLWIFIIWAKKKFRCPIWVIIETSWRCQWIRTGPLLVYT